MLEAFETDGRFWKWASRYRWGRIVLGAGVFFGVLATLVVFSVPILVHWWAVVFEYWAS